MQRVTDLCIRIRVLRLQPFLDPRHGARKNCVHALFALQGSKPLDRIDIHDLTAGIVP